MAQFDYGTIDPNTTSGTDLANMLTLAQSAIETNHSGTSRPTYIKAGMTWLDTSNSTANALKFWTGSADVTLLTINPASGAVVVGVPSGGSSPTYALASVELLGNLSIAGGGDLTTTRAVSLVGDTASPGANNYYGTDGSGSKGFYLLPTPAIPHRSVALYPAGTYTVTVPANVTAAYLRIWGGGASGRDAETSDGDGGTTYTYYAGGWGGCAEGSVNVTPGSTINLVVGAGGTAGGDGQPSWFGASSSSSSGCYVYCSGGLAAGGNGGPAFAGSGVDMIPVTSIIRVTDGFQYGSPGTGTAGAGSGGVCIVEFISS